MRCHGVGSSRSQPWATSAGAAPGWPCACSRADAPEHVARELVEQDRAGAGAFGRGGPVVRRALMCSRRVGRKVSRTVASKASRLVNHSRRDVFQMAASGVPNQKSSTSRAPRPWPAAHYASSRRSGRTPASAASAGLRAGRCPASPAPCTHPLVALVVPISNGMWRARRRGWPKRSIKWFRPAQPAHRNQDSLSREPSSDGGWMVRAAVNSGSRSIRS